MSKAVKSRSNQSKKVKFQHLPLKQAVMKTDIPEFRSGDRIIVKTKIKEGDKFRIQNFEGIVIARNGTGIQETFTVRKVSSGVGVERVFPIHSPMISGIDVKVEGSVRRGKIYYLRELAGKASRIKNKKLAIAVAGLLDAPEAEAAPAAPASNS
jgi:large subunit ribosomal protein L19